MAGHRFAAAAVCSALAIVGALRMPIVTNSAAAAEGTVKASSEQSRTDFKSKTEIQRQLRGALSMERIEAVRRTPELGKLEATKLLVQISFRDPATEVRRAAYDVIAQCSDTPEVCEFLLKAAVRDARGIRSRQFVPASCCALLIGGPEPIQRRTLDLLDKLAKAPAATEGLGIVTAVADELGAYGGAAGAQTLVKLAKLKSFDDVFAVRRSVVQGLKMIHQRESVESLIGLLDKLEGEAEAEAVNHLVAVTRNEGGLGQAAVWKQWWDKNKDEFTYSQPTETSYALDGQSSYYGLPLYAKRLVFIIDVSSSMRRDQKIFAAKRELAQAVERLPQSVAFNIVTFHSQVDSWQKRLVQATHENKQIAAKFIDELGPGGMTASYDALSAGLQFDGEAIYFLTDGWPTAGKIVDAEQIVAAISQVNRARRITIHCIGVGAGAPGSDFDTFLKSLADYNYGKYRRVDE